MYRFITGLIPFLMLFDTDSLPFLTVFDVCEYGIHCSIVAYQFSATFISTFFHFFRCPSLLLSVCQDLGS